MSRFLRLLKCSEVLVQEGGRHTNSEVENGFLNSRMATNNINKTSKEKGKKVIQNVTDAREKKEKRHHRKHKVKW